LVTIRRATDQQEVETRGDHWKDF